MNLNIQAVKAGAADIARAIGVSEPDFATRTAIIEAVREAEQKMRKLRVRLLLDLANLPPDSPRLLRLMESFDHTPQEAIAAIQKALRTIWQRDLPLDTKQWMVDVLYAATTRSPFYPEGLYAVLGAGNLLFAAKNFPGQILTGILEHWPQMARCANPECTVPYFFTRRSTQRYCERGECTKYALRNKAKRWWTENRAKSSVKQKARKKRK